ncbi:MAG: hypothetical protein AMXMBFR47_30250 [Planctomycetota bacterium]
MTPAALGEANWLRSGGFWRSRIVVWRILLVVGAKHAYAGYRESMPPADEGTCGRLPHAGRDSRRKGARTDSRTSGVLFILH